MATKSSDGQWIEEWLSIGRFSTYLAAAGGCRSRARDLYEWNAKLSAAFLHDLSHRKVCLRTACDRQLAAATEPGDAHWTDPATLLTLFHLGSPSSQSVPTGHCSKSTQRRVGRASRFFETGSRITRTCSVALRVKTTDLSSSSACSLTTLWPRSQPTATWSSPGVSSRSAFRLWAPELDGHSVKFLAEAPRRRTSIIGAEWAGVRPITIRDAFAEISDLDKMNGTGQVVCQRQRQPGSQ